MDTPHYVHNYVIADVLPFWMIHFTHHNDMDAPQYVNADVLSDVILAWKFHYTSQRYGP